MPGTIIGVILERSGAVISMAETVIRLLGERFTALTLSISSVILRRVADTTGALVAIEHFRQSQELAPGQCFHKMNNPLLQPMKRQNGINQRHLG